MFGHLNNNPETPGICLKTLDMFGHPISPDRSDRSGPEEHIPKLRCHTWSTKLTLDHPNSTKLVPRGFLLVFSLR